MYEKKNYFEKLSELILSIGGNIEDDIFVTKPGCVILNKNSITQSGQKIYQQFNIDQLRPEYEQIAEFKSRITYLAFKDTLSNSKEYNEKMAKEYQHLSVHAATQVELLIAGISLETALELIAHSEAKVGRLTSSKTKAMNKTLYRVQGTEAEKAYQKNFIVKFLKLKETCEGALNPRELSKAGDEFTNILNLGSKVTVLTYSMSLKDFHKLFIGRLSSHGNETEVQEICSIMCEQLHRDYPLVIRSVEEYYALNNGEKYKI